MARLGALNYQHLGEVQRFEEIGLARSIATVDGSHRQDTSVVLPEFGQSVSVLAFPTGNHREGDGVAERHPVFDREANDHVLTPCERKPL